ncbi:L-galactonate dehydratase-like [Oopsacas minuta]|uniref:L-galactonate dehydratase-like n=1 Tax=Oopsacas minuta TaxID=111878 RepID=A0AAV7JN24_9METZ|nr:L-galactonate dehydratase-like [Oopsacas minuta]
MSVPADSDRVCTTFPKVKEVRAYIKDSEKGGQVGQGGDCHDVPTGHWIGGSAPHMPIANPMSGYEMYEDDRNSWGIGALGSLVVEVETTEGDKGVGVSLGGEAGCYIVEKHLSRFVEGQNPADIELMWDQMYKSTINYGRKGLPLQAISAVDLALWDLLGHLRREPVYQMLGGRTKPYLPVYSTTCDALQAKKFGFVGAKIGCPYGPSAGGEGLKKNVEMFKNTRKQVGDEFPLMLDCYMALTLSYSIQLARELKDLKFKWIEEALPPDDYQGYRELTSVCR